MKGHLFDEAENNLKSFRVKTEHETAPFRMVLHEAHEKPGGREQDVRAPFSLRDSRKSGAVEDARRRQDAVFTAFNAVQGELFSRFAGLEHAKCSLQNE